MNPKTIQTNEIMSTKVLTLRAGTSLRDAMTALEARGISGAPVIDEAGRCVGVFSLANVARAGNYFGAEPPLETPETRRDVGSIDDETVEDWMSRDVRHVTPRTSVEACAKQMSLAGMHRLLVLEDGAIAGIVSSLDIVRLVAGLARAEEPEMEPIEAAAAEGESET